MNFKHLALILVILFSIYMNLPAAISFDQTVFGRHYKGYYSVPSIDLSFISVNFKRDRSLKEGLDLQGGSHLVFDADTSKLPASDRQSAVEAVQSNIERRINLLGVSEPVVQTAKNGDSYRLIVEMAGIKDISQAISLIGTTAQLDFRELSASPSATATSASLLTDFKPTGLTGADLSRAQYQTDSNTGAPSVGLQFTSEGAKKFSAITKRNIGRPLAIFLDDYLVSAPTVSVEIGDGQALITGSFTLDEVKALITQLNSGALPIPIKLVEQRTVGATLGTDSVNKSLFAGLVGLVVVAVFMIANYGRLGIVADIALVLYILLSLTLFRLIPVTMTLAGIAGFILSIGMAVDANILIFERTKEETRWGRPKKAAMDLGFSRAWTSIRDSNVSSLITCSILFWLGTGSVRGFALTLAIGILVSLFTSINVTRALLGIFYREQI